MDSDKHYLQAELEKLMRDPSMLSFLDEGTLDGMWYWDLENPEHEWMSPGFWRTLGFDPATRAHNPDEWQDLIFPEDRDLALHNFERHLEDPNHPYDQVVRYRTAEGGTVTIRCRGFAIRENGVPKRMLGAHTLLADSRRDDLSQRLDYLFSLSNDAVVAWTPAAGVQRWNRGAELLFGYARHEAMGSDPAALLATDAPGSLPEEWTRLEVGEQWTGDVAWTTKERDRIWTSTRIQRVAHTGDGPLMLLVARDATDRVQTEHRQELLTRELRHRVRNLFAVVNSLIEVSAMAEPDVATMARNLSSRVRALSAANMLSLGGSANEGSDLESLIGAIVDPHVFGGRAATLSGPAIPLTDAAVTPLGLIFHELATNAVKYGAWHAPDGRVEVTWEAGTMPSHPSSLTWREHLAEGQPPPKPGPEGFGTQLMRTLAGQLDAHISFEYDPTGAVVRLAFSPPPEAAGPESP